MRKRFGLLANIERVTVTKFIGQSETMKKYTNTSLQDPEHRAIKDGGP